MTTWQVQIEALQPISIARQISSQAEWATTHFIPGSTWRGAVAEHWKYTLGFEHPQTKDFISDCIFHDAHEKDTRFTPSYFKYEKKTWKPVNLLTHYLQHGEFLATHNEQPLLDGTPYTANVIETTAMGIQMSRTRESTEQGKLYTMTSIAEGTTFYTTAIIPEELLQLIAPTQQLTVYIGKKRFSGYGKARITFTKQQTEQVQEDFLAWQQYAQTRGYVAAVLTAKSPIVLYDAFLRPAKQLEWAQHVKPLLPQHLQHLQPISEETWAIGAVRSGWQQAWDAPKPTEQVLLPGATYIALFEAKQDEVQQAVDQLTQHGVGERLQEGFGQVILAPLELQQQENRQNSAVTQAKELFTAEEEATILAEAHNLVGILQRIDRRTGKSNPLIPLAQWQMLISAQNPIEEITSTHEMAYIQKRLNTKVRNVWSASIKGEKSGYVLRRKVEAIAQKFEKRSDVAVRLLLQFSARHVRMQTKGEPLYDR